MEENLIFVPGFFQGRFFLERVSVEKFWSKFILIKAITSSKQKIDKNIAKDANSITACHVLLILCRFSLANLK